MFNKKEIQKIWNVMNSEGSRKYAMISEICKRLHTLEIDQRGYLQRHNDTYDSLYTSIGGVRDRISTLIDRVESLRKGHQDILDYLGLEYVESPAIPSKIVLAKKKKIKKGSK